MQNLLSTEQLASALHISVRSLRNRLSLNPRSLPPAVRLPGARAVLFREDDVQLFISQHITARPGRPTKRQQFIKNQELQHSAVVENQVALK
jgi:predicted DNA-binding transcriptional regulator AlpA